MHYLGIGIIVILAVLLDLWLMRGWRRWLQKSDPQDANPKVYLWGNYSPLLTWLCMRSPRFMTRSRLIAFRPADSGSPVLKFCLAQTRRAGWHYPNP